MSLAAAISAAGGFHAGALAVAEFSARAISATFRELRIIVVAQTKIGNAGTVRVRMRLKFWPHRFLAGWSAARRIQKGISKTNSEQHSHNPMIRPTRIPASSLLTAENAKTMDAKMQTIMLRQQIPQNVRR